MNSLLSSPLIAEYPRVSMDIFIGVMVVLFVVVVVLGILNK